MRLRQLAWFMVVPAALSLNAFVLAEGKKGGEESKTAEENKGMELLKSKGLRKSGSFFIHSDETALRKKLRELDPLRKKMIDAQQKSAKSEKIAEQKKQLINQCLQQRHVLEVQLNNAKNVDQHNKIVNAINELSDRIEILEKSMSEDKETKKARAVSTEVTAHYVEAMIQLRKQIKEIKAKYDALATDDQIKEAIADANKTESSPCKLGPGSDFAVADRTLKKLEGNLLSETISMQPTDGDMWTVSATFNGKHACELTVDTGASMVVLPYQTASAVGMTPSEQDPTITCTLADGHTIQCKRVYAKTLRVGKFIVQNVECGIMPEESPNASALLGQSFLKHFTFRIDNVNGKLIMAQVGLPGARGAGKRTIVSRTEETGEDKTAIPPADEKGGPEQMVAKLLKLDNEKAADRIEFNDSDGNPIQMSRSKWETVENLRKMGGDPDEMYKVPMKPKEGEPKAAPWKMYTWGPLLVLVDDTGHARYFYLGKEKEKDKE